MVSKMSTSLQFICVAVIVTAAAATNFSDCGTSLGSLERALYETEGNLMQLNRIFFPRNLRSSRFINVIYTFLDEFDGRIQPCNVSYILAIGSVLFIQPPRLFMFNSLFLNYPNNDLTDLPLTLPHECRSLIGSEINGSCSCRVDCPLLEVLTQQLHIYAKYTDQGNVERKSTYAREVCSESLYDIYYKNNASVSCIIAFTISLPFIIFIISFALMRKLNYTTLQSFTKPSKQNEYVALGFVGALLTLYVIIIDVLACSIVANNDHEYSKEITGVSINLYVVYITLVLDVLFAIPLLLCILYIMYVSVTQFFGCENKCLPTKLLRCCCRVFIRKQTLNRLSDDEIIAVIFPFMYATPLLCVSSHVGYMFLAWITEPSKATTSLLFYYTSLVYLFLAFRKLYGQHSRTTIALNCRCLKNKSLAEVIELDSKDSTVGRDEHQTVSEFEGELGTTTKKACCYVHCAWGDTEHINPQAICLLSFYSVIVVGVVVLIGITFILLPLGTDELIVYISNAVQLVIVLITSYLTLKFFFGSDYDFNLKETLESFRKYYSHKSDSNQRLISIAKDESISLEEATGALAAELTYAIHKSARL